MLKPMLILAVLGAPWTLAGFASSMARATPGTHAETQTKTHEGRVVSTADGKLVMTDKDGQNQHSHMIPASAIITLDGKSAKLNELKKGDSVKVTTGAEGNVTAVAAQRSKT